jgi:predicted dinucleotide-binding enzyme
MARIAVLGAGRIGGTIGDAWRRAGHDVTFGVRDAAGRDGGGRTFASPVEAVRDADVVLFAVPGGAMDATVASLADHLHGRVLIDASNRVGMTVMHSERLLALGNDRTFVFRAFNALGWEIFANPRVGEEIADLFFSGPDGPARRVVEGLIEDVGLRPIYVGADPNVVDGALRLWFAVVSTRGRGRNVAFKVLER